MCLFQPNSLQNIIRFRFLLMALFGLTVIALAGCASQPIHPSYVPPTNYQSLDCKALHAEYARVDSYLRQGVDEPSSSIFSGMSLGLGAFGGSGFGWGLSPSISFHHDEEVGSQRSAYAQVLGQRDALIQEAAFKGCPIVFAPPPASS